MKEHTRRLVDPHAQADPKFQTPFASTRITAKAVREALLFVPELAGAVPSRQTVGDILNRLGYKLRRVLKARPQKRFLRPTPTAARHCSEGAHPPEDDILIRGTTPLFPWDELDVSPTLATIREALTAIPDGDRLAALDQRRHNGCDTDPASVLCVCRKRSIFVGSRRSRATPRFERLYKGRSRVERVNDRLKVWWGLDDGNVVGSRRFCAHMPAVLIVHPAFATLLAKAQRQEGSFGTMTLSPTANKLQELIGEKDPNVAEPG